MAHAKARKPPLWGFKEPHTMFFLHGLHRRYAAGRYILVLRHGLDMAHTGNDQHFRTWSPSYGLDPKDSSPSNRFEFWYRSNQQVLELATRWFGERFLIVRLEELCLDAKRLVPALLRFVGIGDEAIANACCKIPRLPISYGRYRRFDRSWINHDVETKLARLGYSLVDDASPTTAASP
jgi:hypothetical protein